MKPLFINISIVSLTNTKCLGARLYGGNLIILISGLNSITCSTTCCGMVPGNSSGNTSEYVCTNSLNCCTFSLSILLGIFANSKSIDDDCLPLTSSIIYTFISRCLSMTILLIFSITMSLSMSLCSLYCIVSLIDTLLTSLLLISVLSFDELLIIGKSCLVIGTVGTKVISLSLCLNDKVCVL